MQRQGVKICPTCGCEYRATAEVCADCGGLLKFPEELESRQWRPEEAGPVAALDPVAATELPASPDLVCIRTAQLDWTRELVARLTRRGVRARVEVERTGSASREEFRHWFFRVYVRPQDADAAASIDREYVHEHMPELASLAGSTGFNPGACPACGASVPAESRSCPECELALLDEDPEPEAPS